MELIDGPLGVRNTIDRPEGRATAFPSTQTLAASFDPELADQVGRIMGREARDRGFNVLLAGVRHRARCLERAQFRIPRRRSDPGRRIVSAQIRGIQSQGVVSTVKHFVANTEETDRTWVDMVANERSLREIDLLPFRDRREGIRRRQRHVRLQQGQRRLCLRERAPAQ